MEETRHPGLPRPQDFADLKKNARHALKEFKKLLFCLECSDYLLGLGLRTPVQETKRLGHPKQRMQQSRTES